MLVGICGGAMDCYKNREWSAYVSQEPSAEKANAADARREE